ncbi:hypothetical protein [Micromonospora avicenniae]|uniref:Uncharacterized protein n=1 Tax=Micromonospora avicenniae TaxID=1198245 RepID=A0A1N6R1N2_9ACTN|nr:hypothetical protein [Micromonospora avicenniae]SIQ22723.1 hypothetical protein SAMN05444858_101565 [Micromonospora avicenniae]
MPAPEAMRSRSLLTTLFWIGVGLAPVAALILLVADGNGPLRFAAVLAIVAVVLIGLSIALRSDGESGQDRLAEVFDEMDQLRRELRGEIVAAAQRGNQALDQAQRAQEAVAAVHRRLEATGAALAGAAVGGAAVGGAEEPVGSGRARVPVAEPEEDVPAGRARAPREESRSRWADDEEPAPRSASGRHGTDLPNPEPEWPAPSTYGARAGSAGERTGAAGYGGERTGAAAAGVYGAGPRPGEQDGRPEPRQMGVVRHTETVHVTTRHTIVDGGPAESPGGRYGGGYSGGWSPPADERQWGTPEEHRPQERSWSGYGGSDERSRSDDEHPWAGAGGPRGETGWDDPRAGRRDERGWSAPDDQWDRAEPDRPAQVDDAGQYWSQMRAGDRWASVRDDDRGREVRMGERRAEVHADATGSEYRVADRWAAVRRDEPQRGYDEGRRGNWVEPEERALPAGGVPVPDEWRPPRQRGPVDAEPERVGRRARVDDDAYDYPPRDDGPRGGGSRWR